MLQFWLAQADNDLDYSSMALPDMSNTPYTSDPKYEPAHPHVHRAATSETSDTASTGNIPNERFARVENCWLAKNNGNHHLNPSLWSDIVRSPGPNLFSIGASQTRESALESSNGGNFISNAFTNLLRKVHNDLALNAMTPSAPHARLAIFAAGFLTLCLAAFSGDNDRLAQSQTLYATLIATAQRQGLFCVDDIDVEDTITNIGDENSRWLTWARIESAKSIIDYRLVVFRKLFSSAKTADLNSLLLWHNLCLTLNSNMQIFELAAGRAGAGPAGKALADVEDWARTSSARRACIHAAQSFKLLSNRKVSESITLNSMSALFCSALVLGLYLFTVPSSDNESASLPYELMDDVDWTVVGNAGMAESSPGNSPDMIFESSHASNVTRAFIEAGGPVSINGVVATSGFQTARRTLLDFAHLMDGIGTWKPRTLSRILHIMSDVLEESL
ncbi:hypothetical protein E4T48_00439 [Aureobasidium sp. EXF-10727]|nr:hypothetical protein E4T48_00439 [Aureobasidium sp. EXF-10727]KAI4729802.1 hypothetical protein E4T49_02492 [Aureobasidium sp. EXF-10728]